MSRKASVVSVSRTTVAGISPATIRQNRQSFSIIGIVGAAAPDRVPAGGRADRGPGFRDGVPTGIMIE
ncbi:hypothetical protein Pen02_77090 [Plantactinospora endophytica]|uniref:Uncharacterized protein n=1 Tax=Plantactinospora endophytica TaxID=673535 RepID=A0ABQ4EDH1_9ACTN|nr:hypothetical protein Pen02_77090 [Plantactinospora endophytica]